MQRHVAAISGEERDAAFRQERWAMNWSLALGVVLLVLKVTAYVLTGSSAIYSDAAESVIHVAAVGFAVFSLHLSYRAPTRRFPFGFEKIAFFSAGVEGTLISLAAVSIFWLAGSRLLAGAPVERLGSGALLILCASLLTGGMGWYLVRLGKHRHSLVLEANGRHVATDSITSFGVVAGLLLVQWTGWETLDPLVALAIGAQILFSGAQMMRKAFGGLMDWADPATEAEFRRILESVASSQGIEFHELRLRNMGRGVHAEMHLLFPYQLAVGEAHARATALERELEKRLPYPALLLTHLEAREDHERMHPGGHGMAAEF